MVEVPKNDVTNVDIQCWLLAKKEKAAATLTESTLRHKIFNFFFPMPTEKTQNAALGGGYGLKGKQDTNRSVDPGVLQAMGQKFVDAGINLGVLVKWKPELAVSEYRKLTDAQRVLFDECLTIKEGSITLDFVEPKVKEDAKTETPA